MSTPVDPDELRRHAVRALAGGPLAREELLAVLRAEGEVSKHQFDRLLQLDTAFVELGAGVAYLPVLLADVGWLVPVPVADAAEGFLRMDPHLSPLGWWLIEEGADLVGADGEALGRVETDSEFLDGVDTDVLYGPRGWLDALAGEWAVVTASSDGLRVRRAAPSEIDQDPSAAQADAISTAFDRAARPKAIDGFDGERVTLVDADDVTVVLEAVQLDRAAFAGSVVPPLPALFAAAGLEQHDHLVARSGFDWETLHAWQRRNLLGLRHGLATRQVDLTMLLVGACESFIEDGAPALGATDEEVDGATLLLAGALEDGVVARAFWVEVFERGNDVADLARFAEILGEHVADLDLSGVAWLRARCTDRMGDAATAAELLARLPATSAHVPALLEAAGFAADRGDAPAALRLAQRAHDAAIAAGAAEDAEELVAIDRLIGEVDRFARRPRPAVGRNDPCPCGSGRKYKACHLGRETHLLAERAPWLFEKAMRFLHGRDELVVQALADEMSGPDVTFQLRDDLASSPFIADLALHEDGACAAFLASRSELLPVDEALLATDWLGVDRSVFEVVAIEDDELELRDVVSDEHLTVVGVQPNAHTRPGVLLVGRPLPVGHTRRAFSGFVDVPPTLVPRVVAAIDSGDAYEIAATIGERFRSSRPTGPEPTGDE